MGVAHHALGHRADDEMGEAAAPMGSHHDRLRAYLLRHAQDLRGGLAADDVAVDGAEVRPIVDYSGGAA